jgi:hypothetical protein
VVSLITPSEDFRKGIHRILEVLNP